MFWLVTRFILGLSVALQNLVGFELGMVSIPLLLLRGYPLALLAVPSMADWWFA